jgi:hypothetical protein
MDVAGLADWERRFREAIPRPLAVAKGEVDQEQSDHEEVEGGIAQ